METKFDVTSYLIVERCSYFIIIITIFKHGTISQYIKYLQKRKKKSDLPIGRVLNYYINIKKNLLLINLIVLSYS